jgi:hypothetical protein
LGGKEIFVSEGPLLVEMTVKSGAARQRHKDSLKLARP